MVLNQRHVIIFFCFIFLVLTQISYAGPILYRVQQKKMMEQQQRQLQIQEMIEVHHHAAIIVDEQQQAPTYPQMVDHRNQAIAQAILNAHTSSGNLIAGKGIENPSSPTLFQRIISTLRYLIASLKHFMDGIIGFIFNKAPVDQPNQAIVNDHNQDQQQSFSSRVGQQAPVAIPAGSLDANSSMVQQAPSVAPAGPADAQEEVDLSEVWKKLDKKSTVWTILADDQAKLLTVSEYIGRYQKEGVKITQPPAHYIQLIDQLADGNPQMLQRPFGELLQILAIVDYDFDNGMDKDSLAKQVLGEEGYEQNKKRFSQPQQQQQPQQRQ